MDLLSRRGIETKIYDAAEDSHLLATAAKPFITTSDRILDVGTGSGYVADYISKATGAHIVGSDINPFACERANDRGVTVVRGDLVTPFQDNSFDIVLFNPPYLPTDPTDEWNDWMEVALSGGPTGRAVIEPFIDAVGRVITRDGAVFVLVSSLMDIDVVRRKGMENGFRGTVVAEQSFPFETLCVLRLDRHDPCRTE